MAHAKLAPLIPNLWSTSPAYYLSSSKPKRLVLSFRDLLTQDTPKLECIYLNGTSDKNRTCIFRLSVGCTSRCATEAWSPREDSNLHAIQLTFLLVRSERVYWGLAEVVGFELTVPCGTTVFKAVALNHSATLPK